jgi:serine/threonine protein kinase
MPQAAPIQARAAPMIDPRQIPNAQIRPAPSALDRLEKMRINPPDFKLDKVLGRGSFGDVHLAINKLLGWRVAIKQLRMAGVPAKEVELFEREVSILAKCNDPFLLKFIGFTVRPTYALVTDYMSSGSLWDYLRKYPMHLNGTQRTNIAIGIAHGMKYLHANGIIHRDLKSANILLDNKMLPHIADFGLGKFLDSGPEVTRATGTIQWMAPEQVFTPEYGPPADVFSYGMILFELLTEQIPYQGLPTTEIYRILQEKSRPRLPEQFAGHPLSDLIFRCWKENPAHRPTFDVIFEMFADDLVAFPGPGRPSDEVGVHRLLAQIERDQQERTHLPDPTIVNEPTDNQSHHIRRLFGTAAAGDIKGFTEHFILSGQTNVNLSGAKKGTPLHCAVRENQLEMIAFLCQLQGIDVNTPGPDGVSALALARQEGRTAAVKIMTACDAAGRRARS